MNNRIKYTLAILAILPSVCFASGLVPQFYTISNNFKNSPFDRPLDFLEMGFDGEIEATKNPKASVIINGKEISVATEYEVSHYDLKDKVLGNIIFYFSGECLPVGETYTLRVEPESICLADDKTVTNDAIEYSFVVPADLGDAYFGYENGSTIAGIGIFICQWHHEATAVGNPAWEVYREGDLVRKYPCDISSDWDLGSAYLRFNEELHFEAGVKYRVQLPDGSAQAKHPGILNKDTYLDFVGGYDGELQYPVYDRCSIHDPVPESLGEVSFYYKSPINLVPGKPLILSERFQTENKRWTAMPKLTSTDDEWVITVDFGGIPLELGKAYTLELPEGTVVTAKGDITVNKRQEIQFNGTAGTGMEQYTEILIEAADATITVGNAPEGAIVQVFTPDGKVVSSEKAKTETLTIEGLSRGIYIVRTAGIVRSVMLK